MYLIFTINHLIRNQADADVHKLENLVSHEEIMLF